MEKIIKFVSDNAMWFVIATVLIVLASSVGNLFGYLENRRLRNEATVLKQDIEKIVEEKIALDKEIAVMKAIITNDIKDIENEKKLLEKSNETLKKKRSDVDNVLERYDNVRKQSKNNITDNELRDTLCELYGCPN